MSPRCFFFRSFSRKCTTTASIAPSATTTTTWTSSRRATPSLPLRLRSSSDPSRSAPNEVVLCPFFFWLQLAVFRQGSLLAPVLMINGVKVLVLVLYSRGGVHAVSAEVANKTTDDHRRQVCGNSHRHCALHNLKNFLKKAMFWWNWFFAYLVSHWHQCLMPSSRSETLLINIHLQSCICLVRCRKPTCKSQPEPPEVWHGQQQDPEPDTGAHHSASESQQEQRAGGEDRPAGV